MTTEWDKGALPLELDATGLDGLNLVEFPLSVLSRRAPTGKKTLEFSERGRRKGEAFERHLTITGSDKFGLPTYQHHDVLVALMQMTWEKNGASSPRVEFTRYELLELLGWDHGGRRYRLAEHALDVWMGTTLYYKDSWWVDGIWKSKKFHVLDDAELYGRAPGSCGRRTKDSLADQPSYVVWGSVPFADFQEKRTKGLDFSFYRSLKYAVSRQLYRYLDKWFYYGPSYRYADLRMFACDKIGVSRSHDNSNLMRELDRGVGELVERGYLRDNGKEKRYRKQGNLYEVVFERATKRKAKVPKAELLSDEKKLVAELRKRGLKNKAPLQLVAANSAKAVRDAIENYDDRIAHGENLGPGYLVSALQSEEGFSFRKGYRSKAEVEVVRAAIEKRNEVTREHEALRCQVEKMQEGVPVKAIGQLGKRHRELLEEEAVGSVDTFLHGQIKGAQESGDAEKLAMLRQVAVGQLYKRVKQAVESEEDSRGCAVAWVEQVKVCMNEILSSDAWEAYQLSLKRVREVQSEMAKLPRAASG